MLFRKKKEKTFEHFALKVDDTILIGDCPFKIMNKGKYKVVLYNEENNNLILTDNYNRNINDITDIFMDVRFGLLYYAITHKKNLIIVIRSDEGLTNDYYVFENNECSKLIEKKLSFIGILKTLKGKDSYFLN